MSRATDIYSAPVTFSAVRDSGDGRSPQRLDCFAVERFELSVFSVMKKSRKKLNSPVERRRLREREGVIRAGGSNGQGRQWNFGRWLSAHGCGTGAVPERRGDGEVFGIQAPLCNQSFCYFSGTSQQFFLLSPLVVMPADGPDRALHVR